MTRPQTDQMNGACQAASGRVLMIACAFPPTGGPGVQRTVKFAKYLPENGWRPVVLASEPLAGLPEDPSLLDDLPADVTVYRIRQDRIVRWARRLERGALVRRFAGRVVSRLRTYRARSLLPDDQIGWAKRSLAGAIRLLQRGDIDLIYSTYSPASNHWLAWQLKRRFGLPWVADFRDLWTDDYRYDEPSASRRVAHRRLEQTILETADAVIGVTERQTRILADRLPAERGKFITITNGFDPADFVSEIFDGHSPSDFGTPQNAKRAGPPGCAPFTMAHVGWLDRRRAPEAFFAGIERFAETLSGSQQHIVIELVGHAGRAVVERWRAAGLDVRHDGHVAHGKAIARMRRANLLLLPIPEGPHADTVIPAKLFEYLASHRPILAIGPVDGEAARVIDQCRAGTTVPFEATAIATALRRLYTAWSHGMPMPGCSARDAAPFNRVLLTRALAALFDQVTKRRSPSCGAASDGFTGEPVEADDATLKMRSAAGLRTDPEPQPVGGGP